MNETPQSAAPTAPLIGEPISMPPLSGEVPPQGRRGSPSFLASRSSEQLRWYKQYDSERHSRRCKRKFAVISLNAKRKSPSVSTRGRTKPRCRISWWTHTQDSRYRVACQEKNGGNSVQQIRAAQSVGDRTAENPHYLYIVLKGIAKRKQNLKNSQKNTLGNSYSQPRQEADAAEAVRQYQMYSMNKKRVMLPVLLCTLYRTTKGEPSLLISIYQIQIKMSMSNSACHPVLAAGGRGGNGEARLNHVILTAWKAGRISFVICPWNKPES